MASTAPNSVLSFTDARSCVEQHAATLQSQSRETELRPILDSLGQVLAEDITADRDFPPFPRATRDGYALRAQDLSRLPARLKVIGQIKAGASLPPEIGAVVSGTCVEIMTGAPVPDGADAVVMVEYTSAIGNQVEITRSVKAGDNIVPTGSEAQSGQV
ncbi:MAG: molybdopterin molybdochelatase, partial [Candidatus Angelobacter sp.]|nr:molybdopterin molybdochelatase [Candidatus Angelobacter sp.]